MGVEAFGLIAGLAFVLSFGYFPTAPERNHYHEFVDAVLAGPGTVCSAGFDYASRVTEAVLGSVAEHYPNETLKYDPATMRVTSHKEPNTHLSRTFRKKYLLTRL